MAFISEGKGPGNAKGSWATHRGKDATTVVCIKKTQVNASAGQPWCSDEVM